MTASPGQRRTTRPRRRTHNRPTADAPSVNAHGAEEAVGPGQPADSQVPSAPVEPTGSSSGTGESPLRQALSILTTLGPPLTIATALMLYFGWARGVKQSLYMGLDVSLFGFSTQDYVLLSVSTLYIPLLAIAVLTLGWLALHHRVVRALDQSASRQAFQNAGRAALGIGLLVAAGAVVTATLDQERVPLVVPLALAGGTATAAYGGWLARTAANRDDPVPMPWQRALGALLVGGVITLALFWELSNYSGVVGRGYALQIASQLPSLPRATAFSSAPLGIQAPGVAEERLDLPGIDNNKVQYRTTGLRFLTRSGGRLFLLHDGWTPQRGTVIVLPDNDQVRWQFSH
jgi:hypothetical protein